MKIAGRAGLILVFVLIFTSPCLTYAVSVAKCDLHKDYNINAKDLKVIADHWLDTCGDCNGADLDNNGNVNMADFALFAPHWQTEINYAVAAPRCDLVKDYNIDAKDLGVIADNWLLDCTTYDCHGADLDNNGTVNMADFAFFAQHWNDNCLDLDHLWGFIDQQWNNTMYMLTHDSSYSGTGCMFPRSVDLSTGKWIPNGMQWASGYIPGALWYLYQRTSLQQWRTWAETWTTSLVTQQNNGNNHEVGSVIFRSYGLGYKMTLNPAYKPVIFQACSTLLSRYYSNGYNVGCIKSWNGHRDVVTNINYDYPVITDGMMMLEILFWGAKNGGDQTWYDKAVSHANKTMQNNIRPNGSSWQIVAYDPSGAVIKRLNKQGININRPGIDNVPTTWSRGQAWGIAGFAMAYRETLDPNYLATARKCADYFIDHLPLDYVPYWDFNAPDYPPSDPNSHLHRDSSAAAIAASGLLELSTFLSDYDPNKLKYQNAAINILKSLASSAYLAEGTNSMGILLHGTGNGNPYFEGEVDRSLMYGDHFFIEALMRYEDLFY